MTNILLPSVQSLLIEMSAGSQPLGTGTAFVADSASGPVLVTNRHNVTGRRQDNHKPLSPTGALPDTIAIVHNQKGKLGNWVVRKEVLTKGGSPRWVEHPTLGAKADMVALPLTVVDDVELYPYDVADTGPKVSFGPAEVVSVIGFPFGLQAGGSLAVWATGFVASEPAIDLDDLPVFLIDCRSRPGQSGSAVVAHRTGAIAMEDGSTAVMGHVTRFLGIYSGRVHDQSDLGIVWKASAIQSLVASMK
jgi:hypothetical protein